MSTQGQTFVIVGASLAGAKAAETLREEGFDGRLVLIGNESERPYERPPLTKDYLRAESPREKAYVHAEAFYREHDIELMTGTAVTALDPDRSLITLDHGGELGYDRLLLTTGAEPRRLSTPGANLDGVYYLRTLEDCDALRERLGQGGRAAVIGSGWIGAEFAASARMRGADVTVIDPVSVPLERVLGPEVGAIYRDVHRDHGVQLRLGTGVEAFEGERSVRTVKTSDGRTIECDFAVVGIGVVPRVELAGEAGLNTDNGIVVDQSLATSAPGVYAAGDVANAWHPFYDRYSVSSTGPGMRFARRERASKDRCGQHRHQGSRLLRRALRRAPDRPGRRQHDARADATCVRRPRQRRPRAGHEPERGRAILAEATKAGLVLDRITATLEREGVRSFCSSYNELLACIASKLPALAGSQRA